MIAKSDRRKVYTTLGVSPEVAETIQTRKGGDNTDNFLRRLLKMPAKPVRRGRPPVFVEVKAHGARPTKKVR